MSPSQNKATPSYNAVYDISIITLFQPHCVGTGDVRDFFRHVRYLITPGKI